MVISWAEQHWKLLVFLGLGTLYGAFRMGENQATRAYLEEKKQLELRAIEQERELQKRLSEAQSQATKRIEVVRWRTKTIQGKADEWAKTADANCRFDANGLRLWNAANAGSAGGTQ